VDAERSALFPNGVNLREIRPLSDRGGWRDRQKIPRDAFLVLYSGSMGEKQGLELLLEAARMLSSDGRIFFVLCGEGSARERLLSASHGLNNVRFLPLQPASELNAMLNAADLHVLPQLAEAEDLVMPSKLGPILASGGATVATARPGTQIATAVTEAGGVVIPPGDASCLAAAIRDAAQNPARLEAAKRKAREYAESHLNDEAIYDGYFKLIRDSVSAAASKRQQQKSESAHVQKCVS
ncbi:MAG TPA: glycosyltransferase, partial [Planctomycetota bacterium]|nr:glycosyltransferase [Planctomycetota bacterium]